MMMLEHRHPPKSWPWCIDVLSNGSVEAIGDSVRAWWKGLGVSLRFGSLMKLYGMSCGDGVMALGWTSVASR